jgi:hypothetical protein
MRRGFRPTGDEMLESDSYRHRVYFFEDTGKRIRTQAGASWPPKLDSRSAEQGPETRTDTHGSNPAHKDAT